MEKGSTSGTVKVTQEVKVPETPNLETTVEEKGEEEKITEEKEGAQKQPQQG